MISIRAPPWAARPLLPPERLWTEEETPSPVKAAFMKALKAEETPRAKG